MSEQPKKKLKFVIVILSVLLVMSTLALGATILYKRFISSDPLPVVITDNTIAHSDDKIEETSFVMTKENVQDQTVLTQQDTANENRNRTIQQSASNSIVNAESRKSTKIQLFQHHANDNAKFNVNNMFPGDAVTQNYCVQVSFKDSITVNYHADIQLGYDKLAEVLKCKVTLLNSNEVLYEGLMRDMPDSLECELSHEGSTTTELYYEIMTYLETSVGNEYQNQELFADFQWWIEAEENLVRPPLTSDGQHLLLWMVLMAGSFIVLILLLRKQKKEDCHE